MIQSKQKKPDKMAVLKNISNEFKVDFQIEEKVLSIKFIITYYY